MLSGNCYATPPETIGKYLGIAAHGLVAIDSNYRKKILEIIKEKITELTKAKSKPVLPINIKARKPSMESFHM